ncbi:MAG TPA: hypothetical protein VJ816_08305 [Gemmatimonadales bacterium]|nr:hypothetical protein [Gemmatimonadales bacterium]
MGPHHPLSGAGDLGAGAMTAWAGIFWFLVIVIEVWVIALMVTG